LSNVFNVIYVHRLVFQLFRELHDKKCTGDQAIVNIHSYVNLILGDYVLFIGYIMKLLGVSKTEKRLYPGINKTN
jgi:hypothetical protein